MEELLDRSPDLDAVFVSSDVAALGAMQVLRRAGRRIPEDVVVGGCDDSPAAMTAEPPLTTVRQPFPCIAAEMVRLLTNTRHSRSWLSAAPDTVELTFEGGCRVTLDLSPTGGESR